MKFATCVAMVALLAVASGVRIEASQSAVMERDGDLREGRGFRSAITARLRSGEAVEIVGESAGWLEVETAHGKGWVRTHAVTRRPPADLTIQSSRRPAAPAEKSTPSASESSHDDSARQVETAEDFAHVAGSPEPTQLGLAVRDLFAPDRARTLYLRDSPSFDRPLSGRVHSNERIAVLSEDGDWSLVRTNGGVEGWARTASLSSFGSLSSASLQPFVQLASSRTTP